MEERVSERGQLVDDKGDQIIRLQKTVKELEDEIVSLKEKKKDAPDSPK